MKIYVITDEHGDVVASAQVPESSSEDVPAGGRPTALSGQYVHELEIPTARAQITDVEAYHQELADLLKRQQG